MKQLFRIRCYEDNVLPVRSPKFDHLVTVDNLIHEHDILRMGRYQCFVSNVLTLSFVSILQLVATRSLATPLRELRRLVRLRLSESRDAVGFNLAALRAIAKVAQDRKSAFFVAEEPDGNAVWAGMGLGSDVAAALEKKDRVR
jgi:hypothetical protein